MANVSAFTGAMPVIPGGTVQVAEVTRTTNKTASGAIGSNTDIFDTNLTFVADGGTYIVEFFCGIMSNTNVSTTYFALMNGSGTDIGTMGLLTISGAGHGEPVYLQRTYTPSAGSTTINIRAYPDAGTSTLAAGNNTTGTSGRPPMFLRVSKIVNQNDGLKPFWTPPVVTQLPSQATEGDQVLLYSSSPYAGYQTHQYASGSWRTLDDSRGTGAWQTFTPTMSGGSWAPGNGSFAAYYTQIGKTVFYRGQFTFGSTTVKASGNGLAISLPVTSASALQAQGSANYLDSGTEWYIGECELSTSTTMTLGAPLVNGTALIYRGLTSTTPFTWATNDLIRWSIVYEAA
jgi:hypothetical protein